MLAVPASVGSQMIFRSSRRGLIPVFGCRRVGLDDQPLEAGSKLAGGLIRGPFQCDIGHLFG
jgi:hypothetical protein